MNSRRDSLLARARRRARGGGFSHVSTTLEAAAILSWFAVVVISEKHLDDAVTARRAVEASAQDATHASAASCQSDPVARTLGDARPTTHVRLAAEDKLGLLDSALPPVEPVGIAIGSAFGAQQTPLRHANASATYTTAPSERPSQATGSFTPVPGATFSAQRQLSCLDKTPASPTPPVAPLRETLWERNLRGY